MTEIQNSKKYDLEDRTLRFAKEVRRFLKALPMNMANAEDAKQLTRASGSVGANYIEANEALSKKDFRMRIKICRKESKEAGYWLKLVDVGTNPEVARDRRSLVEEAGELTSIFGAIIRKTE